MNTTNKREYKTWDPDINTEMYLTFEILKKACGFSEYRDSKSHLRVVGDRKWNLKSGIKWWFGHVYQGLIDRNNPIQNFCLINKVLNFVNTIMSSVKESFKVEVEELLNSLRRGILDIWMTCLLLCQNIPKHHWFSGWSFWSKIASRDE